MEERFERCYSDTHEIWLKERGKGIGGSDSSVVMGLNPYKTLIELWEEKTRIRIPKDISNKPEVKYGKEAEKYIRGLFALSYPEYEVIYNSDEKLEILVDKENPFLRVSLDGELVEKATGRKGILEIKTTNVLNTMAKEKWKDGVPDNYFCQLLHSLMVTGYDFAVLHAELLYTYNGEKKYTRQTYVLERKEVEQDIELLKEEEIKFWTKHILGNKKPFNKINI